MKIKKNILTNWKEERYIAIAFIYENDIEVIFHPKIFNFSYLNEKSDLKGMANPEKKFFII